MSKKLEWFKMALETVSYESIEKYEHEMSQDHIELVQSQNLRDLHLTYEGKKAGVILSASLVLTVEEYKKLLRYEDTLIFK